MKYILIVITTLTAIRGAPHKGRIYGGQDAVPGQFPFIVAINDPDQYCDGSIIDRSWILTAAHCLIELTRDAKILAGTHIEHSGGVEYNISRTIVHEEYDDWTLKNDIGLIQIDGKLEYSDTIQPIEFGDPVLNTTCTAVGWGITESVDFPDIVQFVNLPAIDLDSCARFIVDDVYLGPEQICTLAPEGEGTCYGDSGGPLICDQKLSGIVSYGVVEGCGEGFPDVYTRPSAYADWIQNNIQD